MMSTVSGLRLFLAVVALQAMAGIAGAESDVLGEDEIATGLTGITLDGVYANGAFFTETYAADGSIRYLDAHGANTGNWSVKDGMFCTFYESQQGACFFVRREGANCFAFYEPKAAPGGTKVPRDQWTSRGWNRAKPSSCVDSPKGTI